MKTRYFKSISSMLIVCAMGLSALANPSFPVNGESNKDQAKKSLPRSTPAAEKMDAQAITNYLEAIKEKDQEIHSLMIVRNGKVIHEQWFGNHGPNVPHTMYSVSKTYTATAIGFAVSEGKLKVTDKVISFFPEKLPKDISDNLKSMEIRHLLMMSTGQEHESPRQAYNDWVESFFQTPIVHKPGTVFKYNSVATYMLSAIIQKVTGEKLIDYIRRRLFEPLGITDATWSESPQGINAGGWGLSIKTEDMAKLGLFILQKGKWEGKQLLPASWIKEATSFKINNAPTDLPQEELEMKKKESDWMQGYCYQMWRCRHNAVRADGANGQLIVILPEKNAVIAVTANVGDMQGELNLIWEYLLPGFK